MATVWEIARQLKTCGVVTHLEFAPNTLTPRIRKAAQRMLESGVITGGWSSQARKVAEIVAKHFDLITLSRSGFHLYFYDRALRRGDIMELLKPLRTADAAAYMLTYQPPSWVSDPAMYLKNEMERHDDSFVRFESGKSPYLSFHLQEFAKQAAELVAGKATEQERAMRWRAVQYLDSAERITIHSQQFN